MISRHLAHVPHDDDDDDDDDDVVVVVAVLFMFEVAITTLIL